MKVSLVNEFEVIKPKVLGVMGENFWKNTVKIWPNLSNTKNYFLRSLYD